MRCHDHRQIGVGHICLRGNAYKINWVFFVGYTFYFIFMLQMVKGKCGFVAGKLFLSQRRLAEFLRALADMVVGKLGTDLVLRNSLQQVCGACAYVCICSRACV